MPTFSRLCLLTKRLCLAVLHSCSSAFRPSTSGWCKKQRGKRLGFKRPHAVPLPLPAPCPQLWSDYQPPPLSSTGWLRCVPASHHRWRRRYLTAVVRYAMSQMVRPRPASRSPPRDPSTPSPPVRNWPLEGIISLGRRIILCAHQPPHASSSLTQPPCPPSLPPPTFRGVDSCLGDMRNVTAERDDDDLPWECDLSQSGQPAPNPTPRIDQPKPP